eukprot:1544887-Pleurochrysis_carterae.AAC.1
MAHAVPRRRPRRQLVTASVTSATRHLLLAAPLSPLRASQPRCNDKVASKCATSSSRERSAFTSRTLSNDSRNVRLHVRERLATGRSRAADGCLNVKPRALARALVAAAARCVTLTCPCLLYTSPSPRDGLLS